MDKIKEIMAECSVDEITATKILKLAEEFNFHNYPLCLSMLGDDEECDDYDEECDDYDLLF